jgi:hypothetical protein
VAPTKMIVITREMTYAGTKKGAQQQLIPKELKNGVR